MTFDAETVRLDRTSEPWKATFPTLGTVHVHADGSVEIDLESVDHCQSEDPSLREAALRHGWGEPLSLVRQGFTCAWGTAMVPPDELCCLIVQGSAHDVGEVMVDLIAAGWAVLSDRLVPTSWKGDELIAFPRVAPVLMSETRSRRAGLTGRRIRAKSGAIAAEVPRFGRPVAVGAFVDVGLRRPDEPVLEELHGHERFRAASLTMIGGALAEDGAAVGRSAGQEAMQTHLAIARLPLARLQFDSDTIGADMAELLQWWSTAMAARTPTSP